MKALTLATFATSLVSFGLIILSDERTLSSTGSWQYLEVTLLPAIHLASTYVAATGLVRLYRRRGGRLGRVDYALLVFCLAIWTGIVVDIVRSDIHKKVHRPWSPRATISRQPLNNEDALYVESAKADPTAKTASP